MRTNLWPGLLQAALHNLNRQQTRVRLFETGLRFRDGADGLAQERVLAGVVTGPTCRCSGVRVHAMPISLTLKAISRPG